MQQFSCVDQILARGKEIKFEFETIIKNQTLYYKPVLSVKNTNLKKPNKDK